MKRFLRSVINFVSGETAQEAHPTSGFLLQGEEGMLKDLSGSLPIIALEDFEEKALRPATIIVKELNPSQQYQLIERNGEIALLVPRDRLTLSLAL